MSTEPTAKPGLNSDELSREAAAELPNREVMSILDTGALGSAIVSGPAPAPADPAATPSGTDLSGQAASSTTFANTAAADSAKYTDRQIADSASSPAATAPYSPTQTSVAQS